MTFNPNAEFHKALNGEDELGAVIRGHTYIESRLIELLSALAPAPEHLHKLNLSYSNKARLACALGLKAEHLQPLLALGKIRNEFAHNLKANLTKERVATFYNAFSLEDREVVHLAYRATNTQLQTNAKGFRRLSPRDQFTLMTVTVEALLSAAISECCQHRLRVTFDTNVADNLDLLLVAKRLGFETFVTSVTRRELLPSDIRPLVDGEILELAVLDESSYGSAVLGRDDDAKNFEVLLSILSNNAFPKLGKRGSLSDGQRRQLRDAQIYASHLHHGHEIFVTNDRRGFINGGRRKLIEDLAQSKIMSAEEFLVEFGCAQEESEPTDALISVSATSNFVREFIAGRMAGFEKDMQICMEPIQDEVAAKIGANRGTRAYLPAVITCCGFLEFLGALWTGRPERIDGPSVVPDFVANGILAGIWADASAVRLLWKVIRHKIAHHTHPYYVTKIGELRYAWTATEEIEAAAFSVTAEPVVTEVLSHRTPWSVPYTHRITVSIPVFHSDMVCAAQRLMDLIADHGGAKHGLRMRKANSCLRSFMPPR